jgi:hypothetical protein
VIVTMVSAQGRRQDFERRGSFLKNPGFSWLISKICSVCICSGFSPVNFKDFPKGVVRTPDPDGDAHALLHGELLGWSNKMSVLVR